MGSDVGELVHNETQLVERSLLSLRAPARLLGKDDKQKDKKDNVRKTGSCASTGFWWWNWGNVKVEMVSASNLPMINTVQLDRPDGYVKFCAAFEGNGKTLSEYCGQTPVARNEFNPRWNFACRFPRPWDADKVEVKAKVYDDNTKEILGAFRGDGYFGEAKVEFPINVHVQSTQKQAKVINNGKALERTFGCMSKNCETSVLVSLQIDRSSILITILCMAFFCCVCPGLALMAKLLFTPKKGPRQPAFEMQAGVPAQGVVVAPPGVNMSGALYQQRFGQPQYQQPMAPQPQGGMPQRPW